MMAKLEGTLKIDFCGLECFLVCVLSESTLLMVGRASRYLARIDMTILHHLFQCITYAKSFIDVIGYANGSSPIVAPKSMNGNVG